jgi:hypothetical protein
MTFVFCLSIEPDLYKVVFMNGDKKYAMKVSLAAKKNIESDPHKIPARFDALAPDPPAALFIPHAPNKEFALSRICIFALTQE